MPSEKKKRALPPPPLDFVTPPKDSLVDDLRYALEHAKELYADIAWDFITAPSPTIIYAHKAILYARSSRSFQDRFLKTNKDANGTSIRSVRLSNPDSIVKTDADPFLVRQELKFFYTSEEGGEDFLAAVDTTDELEQVKLKEDLLYMLNVKLYTDVEIVLDYSDDNLEIIEENEEAFKPIRAHKFMLYTRSDYFRKMLSSDFIEARSSSIQLDANIFDQTSLNLILTFIYTGSISSLKKPLTLDTCESVWIGADYLGIKLLCDECIHRIATKAHYFTCTCTDCQVVVPRIATFAKEEQDVDMLWQGCLHVLSHGFDNMWPQKAFADLDEDIREEVLLTVLAYVQTNNIIAIFKGCRKILSNIDIKGIGLPWIETIRGMTHQVRSYTVQILVDNFEQLCNEDQEFLECVDGIGFSSDLLEDIMNIVVEEGLTEDNSVRVLKCIAGKLLTRQAVMDSENFESKRVLVQTKQNVFDYIKKRWISVKENGGFRLLSPWLLDEFSKELGVTNQELQETTDKETKPKARTPSVTNGLSKKGREASPVSTSKTIKSTTTTPTTPLIVTTSPQPDTSSSSTGNKNTATTNGNSSHAHSPSDSSDKSSSVGSADNASKTNGNVPKTKKGKSVRIGETTTAPVWARPTRASMLRQKALEESSAKNPVKPRTKTTASINSSSSSIISTDSTQSKSTSASKTKTTTTRTLRQSSSSSSLRVPNGTSTSQRGRSSTRKTPKQNSSAASSRASSISSITSVNSPSVSPSRFGGVRQTRSSMLRQLKYDDAEQRRGRDRERGTSPSSSRASSIASTSSVTSNTTTSSHHRRKRSPSQNSTSTSITSTSSGAITSLQPKPHQVKLATVPNPVICVGKRVILPTKNNAPGTIQFLGETEFAKGIWVGIELENPVGKNNGKVANTKYFSAETNHGIFVRPDSLLLI